jgi:hypothetical protein
MMAVIHLRESTGCTSQCPAPCTCGEGIRFHTLFVGAKSMSEAVKIAEKEYPECEIMGMDKFTSVFVPDFTV